MPIQMIITVHPGGKTEVQGPLHDKNFCYRMLFEAFIAILNYGTEKEESPIIEPGVIPEGVLRHFPPGGKR